MGLQPRRWSEATTSEHAQERGDLRVVKDVLPDAEPYRAWSKFEIIADDGTINEVDLLVLSPAGVFVFELKHWSGDLSGDAGTCRPSHPSTRRHPHTRELRRRY